MNRAEVMDLMRSLPDSIILDEMHRRFPNRFTVWLDEDVEAEFEANGWDYETEDVEAVWNRMGDSLMESQAEDGRQVISNIVWEHVLERAFPCKDGRDSAL